MKKSLKRVLTEGGRSCSVTLVLLFENVKKLREINGRQDTRNFVPLILK